MLRQTTGKSSTQLWMFAFLDISDLGLIVEEGPGLGQVLGQADSFMEYNGGGGYKSLFWTQNPTFRIKQYFLVDWNI